MLIKKGKQRRCENCGYPLDQDWNETICPKCGKSHKIRPRGITVEGRAGI
ncbi:hypothetical protein JW968_04705 [Candidatus Woesearchaeota archaeon]|nr:hypothetical protein [Candidatus Woesearchaeota archaeon]